MDPATGRFTAASFAAATDPERMRTVMAQRLRAPTGPPVEVVACQVEFKRRGSPRSLVQYNVTLRDPANGREWTQVVGGGHLRRAAHSAGLEKTPAPTPGP